METSITHKYTSVEIPYSLVKRERPLYNKEGIKIGDIQNQYRVYEKVEI